MDVRVIGEVFEQARQFLEPHFQVIAGVEEDPIGSEHREPVDHTVGQIALLAGRDRIRQLILVAVENRGDSV
jgi:hypothetical protein